VNTRLVEISVVVQGRDGPVADLRKEDFTLLDNGKPQRIDLFVVSDTRTQKQTSAIPMPPGTASNLWNAAGEIPKSATVILFDMMNTSNDGVNRDATAAGRVTLPRNAGAAVRDTIAVMGGSTNNLNALRDQNDAIKQLVRYLRTIREGDRVALFVLGYRLHVIQDFTADTNVLLRAAERLKALDLAGIEVSTQAQLATLLEPPPISNMDGSVTYIGTPGFADSIVITSAINRATATADAFEAIARHLSGLPGRKNLVWMSAGFPFKPQVSERIVGVQAQAVSQTPDDFSSQLNRASKSLNDANVAMYPVDYQGLDGSYPEVMMRLAHATGGTVAYRTNDLSGAVRAAVADGDVSYTLGFYPTDERYDGKLHDLKVRVNRKDVELRYRAGYYSAPKVLTEKQRQLLVGELLESNANSSQIGLVASGEPDSATPGSFKVTISVDAAKLDLTQKADRRTGKLSLTMRLESANVKNALVGPVPLDFSEEQFQNVLKRGFVIRQTVQAKAGDRLRIIVQDQSTGQTGAIWLPLQKP
jgi:VWFA-related protein